MLVRPFCGSFTKSLAIALSLGLIFTSAPLPVVEMSQATISVNRTPFYHQALARGGLANGGTGFLEAFGLISEQAPRDLKRAELGSEKGFLTLSWVPAEAIKILGLMISTITLYFVTANNPSLLGSWFTRDSLREQMGRDAAEQKANTKQISQFLFSKPAPLWVSGHVAWIWEEVWRAILLLLLVTGLLPLDTRIVLMGEWWDQMHKTERNLDLALRRHEIMRHLGSLPLKRIENIRRMQINRNTALKTIIEEAALSDDVDNVRRAAFEALADIGDAKTFDKLASLGPSTDASLQAVLDQTLIRLRQRLLSNPIRGLDSNPTHVRFATTAA